MLIITILEFLDEITTQLNIKKSGLKVESNQIIEKLERTGGEESVFLYKVLSIIGFGVIGWFIYGFNQNYFYSLATVIIVLYAWVVIQNYEVLEGRA